MNIDVLRLLRGCAVGVCGLMTAGCASTSFTTEAPTRQDQIRVESFADWSMCMGAFSNYSLDHPERWNTPAPTGTACPSP